MTHLCIIVACHLPVLIIVNEEVGDGLGCRHHAAHDHEERGASLTDRRERSGEEEECNLDEVHQGLSDAPSLVACKIGFVRCARVQLVDGRVLGVRHPDHACNSSEWGGGAARRGDACATTHIQRNYNERQRSAPNFPSG